MAENTTSFLVLLPRVAKPRKTASGRTEAVQQARGSRQVTGLRVEGAWEAGPGQRT